jgi:Protein of unknown function (DUF3179)
LNGREFHFHLAGINNQNFLMRDEETGSYWQQVTGAAIAGPLKGQHLTLIPQDELSFGLWKKWQPNGAVLAPLAKYSSKYEKADWESEYAKLPTVIHGAKGTLSDRETIIGVVRNGAAQAYPLSSLTGQVPMLGQDGKSVRVFSRTIAGGALEFYGRGEIKGGEPWALFESGSMTEWSFDGCALSGELKGQCLARIDVLKDYWFDWQHYHPQTGIYRH